MPPPGPLPTTQTSKIGCFMDRSFPQASVDLLQRHDGSMLEWFSSQEGGNVQVQESATLRQFQEFPVWLWRVFEARRSLPVDDPARLLQHRSARMALISVADSRQLRSPAAPG